MYCMGPVCGAWLLSYTDLTVGNGYQSTILEGPGNSGSSVVTILAGSGYPCTGVSLTIDDINVISAAG